MDEAQSAQSLERALQAAQLEKLQLENEKLRQEMAAGQKPKPWFSKFVQVVPVITTCLAIIGFLWGVFQYTDQQTKNRVSQESQAKKQQETAEREFMKPWLDNQRAIYLQALAAAAIMSNSSDPAAVSQAREEFYGLYHGKMILVETTDVSAAMVDYGACFREGAACTKTQMDNLLHALAKRMEESMASTARMTFQEFLDHQFNYDFKP